MRSEKSHAIVKMYLYYLSDEKATLEISIGSSLENVVRYDNETLKYEPFTQLLFIFPYHDFW